MRRYYYSFGMIVVWSLFFGVLPAQAQQQSKGESTRTTPIAAYHSPLAFAANNEVLDDENGSNQSLAPDTRSLTGAEQLSIAGPEISRSYWQSHFDVSSTGDSNPLAVTNSTGWTTYTSFLGAVDLHDTSGISDLTLSYLGGGTVSSASDIGNTIIQELNLQEKLRWRRTMISFLDHLNYLPETAFGIPALGSLGGVGGLAVPGVGGANGLALPGGAPVLEPGLSPDSSILTTNSQRIDNSFLAQLDSNTTERSSITLIGGYSLLHYFNSSFINYNDAILQAGYNHQMSRRNTLAVLYRFSAYRYSGNIESIYDNMLQVSFARRLTGRSTFQFAAGPELVVLKTPASNVAAVASSTTSSTQLYWSLTASEIYQLRRGSLRLSYSHGVTGGSGVLAGAISDTVTGSASRQLSRALAVNVLGGFARNQGLSIPGGTSSNQAYNYSFGGFSLSRTLGRWMDLSWSYQIQYQNSNSPVCTGSICGANFIRHLISAGVAWHGHPVALQ